LLIVNEADRSLLQATPSPRYGSGCEGVFVGEGVFVAVGVEVFAIVGVGVLVAVLATTAGLAQVASALATPVPGCPTR